MVCIALPGRIDGKSGNSYTYFYTPGQALAARLHEQVGVPMCLYNDTRAMTYGEFLKGAGVGSRNMLMINVNWGLGMGIVIDSKLFGGKSGYAGEFGHVYGFDNQIICRCGKRGCNETEISGQALQRHLTERIRAGETSILSERVLSSDKPLLLSEIKDAVAREDVLCIEALQQIGLRLGEKTAGLINVFNPELVVLGGELAAAAGDYILDPMRMAVNKHAVHLVSQETEIRRGVLGIDAGAVGACLIARSRYIGETFER
jgi:predicted NBD/HSP70 family sugar kinase